MKTLYGFTLLLISISSSPTYGNEANIRQQDKATTTNDKLEGQSLDNLTLAEASKLIKSLEPNFKPDLSLDNTATPTTTKRNFRSLQQETTARVYDRDVAKKWHHMYNQDPYFKLLCDAGLITHNPQVTYTPAAGYAKEARNAYNNRCDSDADCPPSCNKESPMTCSTQGICSQCKHQGEVCPGELFSDTFCDTGASGFNREFQNPKFLVCFERFPPEIPEFGVKYPCSHDNACWEGAVCREGYCKVGSDQCSQLDKPCESDPTKYCEDSKLNKRITWAPTEAPLPGNTPAPTPAPYPSPRVCKTRLPVDSSCSKDTQCQEGLLCGTSWKCESAPESSRCGLVRIKSQKQKGRVIRRQNHVAKSHAIADTDPLVQDSWFFLRPCLKDLGNCGSNKQCVSLESFNYRGSYLRHQGFVLKLHSFKDNDLFRQDSSFCMGPALSGGQGGNNVSFESVNYKGKYFAADDSTKFVFHLKMIAADNASEKLGASFEKEYLPCP